MRFISHIIIAQQVLGCSERYVLNLMNAGTWGDVFKPNNKHVCVEREKFEQWMEQFRKPKTQLKKAS